MVITVEEAKKKIKELKEQRENFMRLQNYALGLDIFHNYELRDARSKALHALMEDADVSCDIRTLSTIGYQLCENEIKRITSIIDAAKVNI